MYLKFPAILAFGLLFGICAHAQYACPPEKDMKPCVCMKSCPTCKPQMICKNINTLEEIDGVFRRTASYPFKDFTLDRSCILYVSAYGVETKKIENLYVRNGCLAGLFDRPPTSGTLRQIHIQNVNVQLGFQWDLMRNLSALKTVYLRDLKIKRLRKNFGNGLPKSVVYVHFENTSTEYLGRDVLANMQNLENVVFAKSRIREIRRDMFPRPAKITAIVITGSEISTLPKDIFEDMPDLQGITLTRSRLVTVDKDVFGKAFSQLKFLFLSDNPINCNCYVKWLLDMKKWPDYFSGNCKLPAGLENRQLMALKKSDFGAC